MRHLQKAGHKIIAFYRDDKEETVLPEWYNLHELFTVSIELPVYGTGVCFIRSLQSKY